MSKRVSPMEETRGKLSAAFYVRVSVEEEEQIQAAAGAVEEALRRAVAESYPGQKGAAVVTSVVYKVPPAGSGYLGWTVSVVATVDLTVWRRELGPHVDGGYAASTVRDLLKDADLTGTGGRIDGAETQLLVHAPA
ncbi:hypothetical protein ACPCSE_29460 [Streptomyces cellulosae]